MLGERARATAGGGLMRGIELRGGIGGGVLDSLLGSEFRLDREFEDKLRSLIEPDKSKVDSPPVIPGFLLASVAAILRLVSSAS